MSNRMMAAFVVLCASSVVACNETQTAPAPETPAAEAPATEAAATTGQPAFVGTWATNLAGCAIPQEQQGAPHIFHADGYNQHEAHCTFAVLDETSPGTWHSASACTVEGDEASLSLDFSVQGDTMTILPNQVLVRCPAAQN